MRAFHFQFYNIMHSSFLSSSLYCPLVLLSLMILPAPVWAQEQSEDATAGEADPIDETAPVGDEYAYLWEEEPDEHETTSEDFRLGLPPNNPRNSVGGGLTFTRINDENYVGMSLYPEFKIGPVGIGLHIPLLYGIDSQEFRTEMFEDGLGPARIITFVRYGVKKAKPIYAKVGQLKGSFIGFGGLVRNYSNTTSFEKRKVGMEFDVNYHGLIGVEGLYSDFDPSSLNLAVIRGYLKPFNEVHFPLLRTFEVGALYVTDRDQTDILSEDRNKDKYLFTEQGISAVGADAGMDVLKIPFLTFSLYASASFLNVGTPALFDALGDLRPSVAEDDFVKGKGFTYGANFRMNFSPEVFSVDLQVERFSHSKNYIPQFFDLSYEIDKDRKILALGHAKKLSGTYGGLALHILDRVIISGNLLIPDELSASSPATVQISTGVNRLFDKFTGRATYFRGNLSTLGDTFRLDENANVKAQIVYHINRFFDVGTNYYWAFVPIENGNYKVSSTVSPYFGVSFEF